MQISLSSFPSSIFNCGSIGFHLSLNDRWRWRRNFISWDSLQYNTIQRYLFIYVCCSSQTISRNILVDCLYSVIPIEIARTECIWSELVLQSFNGATLCHIYPCWNRLLLPQHIVMHPTVCNPISILVLINYSERHSPRVGRHEPALVLYRRKERVITIHIAQIVSIIRNGNSIQFDPRINSFKCEINFLSFYLRNWQVGCGGHIRFVVSSPKIIILLYKSEWQRPDSRQDNIETLPASFKWAHKEGVLFLFTGGRQNVNLLTGKIRTPETILLGVGRGHWISIGRNVGKCKIVSFNIWWSDGDWIISGEMRV